ncbi:MAG: hypothetical protein ACREH5_08595 [Candidatus Omnitrophota bacterium]
MGRCADSVVKGCVWLAVWMPLLLVVSPLSAAETSKRVDLDGDGHYETQLIYEGKLIAKALMDVNGDGRTDGTIFYKNGFRESGERDANYDGQVDTWIKYYMTGVPWIIARDKNADGKPDYWKYMKIGFIYKREWDRNFDGKPDARVIIPGKADFREKDEPVQVLEKQFDDDFDGQFEKVIKVKKRVPHIKVETAAGAIGEF